MMGQITDSISFVGVISSVILIYVQNYRSRTETKVTGVNWALWF